MSPHKTPRLLIAVIVFAVVTGGIWMVFGNRGGRGNEAAQGTENQEVKPEGGNERVPSDLLNREARERLSAMPTILKACVDAAESKQALDELHQYLHSLPPELAAALVSELLRDPSLDAPTQIAFKVGKGGRLDGHPSLRVALLDWLLEFDVEQAGVVSRELLESPTHPDEWAVALRNVARAEPTQDSFPYLREKTEELIRNADWNVNPSIGFFESFDVLVHVHATESAPLLSELVSDRTPEGKALAHASFLSLDRLTLREPVEMMKRLSGDQELTKARGAMVANMMARGDLREEEQRGLVKGYLLDPIRSEEELRAFAGVFPNANYSISQNLLSKTDTPKGDALRVHDAAVLEVVSGWLGDPEFEAVRPHLEAMQRRLETFVGQTGK